ncbi:hypothetical protein [Lentzea terrae]|uniref:hypothetical protein n=1 Tax=Lentzea terrae TaxID=2200761 RepID=UPI0018E570CD|nr:hypothetical protein [Lentzea terrae]
MRPLTANGRSRLTFWSHVREFAVPTSMIESATARRAVGDWSGACAAARVDVDLNLRALARTHGAQFAGTVRADLRHLAPDLLRWHFPRISPDGLLRPGLTVPLARYGAVHLVARTPPAWADAGQRISLALWERGSPVTGHPHPRPSRRFRLDLHRHLWDARRAAELRERSGTPGRDPTVHWQGEAALLLRAEGRADGPVAVRLGSRRRFVLNPEASGDAVELPDASTWVAPDVELLHAGLIDADRLHPLVASALLPGQSPVRSPSSSTVFRFVSCRGDTHRLGLVDGVLVPLDHDTDELRREDLLVALGGKPLPCLQTIDAVAAEHELEKARRLTYGLYRAGLSRTARVPSTKDTRRTPR